jgi:hypothetical protein
MKGGLVITSVIDPVTAFDCTSGFPAGKTSGGIANHWYMITAGHCIFHGGGNGHSWQHGSLPWGVARVYQFCDRCSADVGVIEVNSWDTPTNVVYGASANDLHSIGARRSNSSQPTGVAVCRSGGKSNNMPCGTITGVDLTVTLHDNVNGLNYIYNHTWKASTASQVGDSGGPMLNGIYAMGIVVGGSTSTYYSTLDWINSSVGYRPCTTAVTNPCG